MKNLDGQLRGRSHTRPGAVLRIFVALILGANLGVACESIDLPLKQAKTHADVVFRGTISDYRDSGNGYKIAVFQVSRVWKGRVGTVVEMSTYPGYSDRPCEGGSTRLVDVGSDVLVFARKVKGQDYLTNYWSGTRAVEGYPYLRQLGPGKPPHGSD
jgi:hypothetical protein